MNIWLDKNFSFLDEQNDIYIKNQTVNVCEYIKNFDTKKDDFFRGLRSIVEMTLKQFCLEKNMIEENEFLGLSDLIKKITDTYKLNSVIYNALQTIKKFGNEASHQPISNVKHMDAKMCLLHLQRILYYFIVDQNTNSLDFDEKIYDSSKINVDLLYKESAEQRIRNDINIQKESLETILSKDIKFYVPIFQRKYVWNEDSITCLLDDIFKRIEDRKSHFFGSILIRHQKNNNKEIYRIIDGQQRLTTTIILIFAIRNLIREKDPSIDINDFWPQIFNKRIDDFFERGNAAGLENENNALKDIVSDKLNKPSNDKSTVYRNYHKIIEILREKCENDINKYKDFIIAYLKYFQLSIILFSNENINNKDEMEIFENINSRGVKLTFSELIKNHILNICDNELIDIKEKEIVIKYNRVFESTKENFVNDFYKTLIEYNTGKETSKNEDKNFRDIKESLNLLFSLNNGSFNDFQEYESFIKNLEKYWNIFNDLLTFNLSNEFRSLHNGLTIKMIEPMEKKKRLLLLHLSYLIFEIKNKLEPASNKDKITIQKIYSCLIKFIIKTSITSGQGNSEIKRYIIKSINEVRGSFIEKKWSNLSYKNLLDLLKEKFKNPTQWNNEDFYSKLKQPIDQTENMVLCLLNLVELNMNGQESTNTFPTTNTKLTLEHIMPQELSKWSQEINNDQEANYNEYINKLGNLAILDKSTNSKISNKSFEDKRKIYEKISYKLLNNDISDIDVSRKQTWTTNDIDNRTKALIDYIRMHVIKE